MTQQVIFEFLHLPTVVIIGLQNLLSTRITTDNDIEEKHVLPENQLTFFDKSKWLISIFK